MDEKESIDERKIIDMGLCACVQAGDMSASEILIKRYENYVKKIARNIQGSFGSDTPFEDLCQEGYIGIICAAQRIDLDRDTTFLTYASFWIMQKIVAACNRQGYTIHIPDNIISELKKISRLDEEYFHLPSNKRLEKIADVLQMPIERLYWLRKVMNYINLARIDKPVMENEEMRLVDFFSYSDIDNNYVPTVEEIIEGICMVEDTRKLLENSNTITERERYIIKQRFGFGDNHPKTLRQVGEIMDRSPNRVRQIEATGLRKLRYKVREKGMQEYIL